MITKHAVPDLPELLLRRRPAQQSWRAGAVAAGLLLMLVSAMAIGGWLLLRTPVADDIAPINASVEIPMGMAPPKVPEEQRFLAIAPKDARALNKQQPFVDNGVVAAAPFALHASPSSVGRAVDCLAAAAWYEAGDDPSGERAVAQVVVNRALSPAFPSSICRVVFQGSERATGCQFTFACDGAMRRTPSAVAWKRSQDIAFDALHGSVDARVGYATHYHTDWVVPYWRDSLDKIAQVNTHLFYRLKGYWGTPSAFRFRRSLTFDEPIVPPLSRLSPAHRGTDGTVLDLPPPDPNTPAAATLPVLAPAPLPEPIAVEGVREKSLRGALVRGQTQAGRFFIQVDPREFSGNYATAAIALCKGRTACTVLGWRDANAMATTTPLNTAQIEALSFLYVRTDAQTDRAMWNCAQVDRQNKAQCLPTERSAIAQFIE